MDLEEMDTMCAVPVEETCVSFGSVEFGGGGLELDEYRRRWLGGLVGSRCAGIRFQRLVEVVEKDFVLVDVLEKCEL